MKTSNRGACAPTIQIVSSLIFLIVLPCISRSQKLPGPQNPKTDPYTIKVDVNMVVLHATVKDHKGVLISGLSQTDFQVYEDGALQEIKSFSHEDIPVTAGLVVDNSGSMAPKRQEVIAAALAFAHSSNAHDQMFVVSFNEHVRFGLPTNTLFTDQAGDLQVALSRMASDGETALYDAVAAALEHLKKGNRDKKVLVVVSDGADNASKHHLSEVMSRAVQSEAIIYALGLYEPDDPDRNPGVLKQLAKATGGQAFMPESMKEIVPICELIARDIRNQYTIAYIPTNRKQDGAYRAIQVKVNAPGHGRMVVRTRAGYYAGSMPQPTPANASNQGGHP